MTYDLDQLCSDIHGALARDAGHDGQAAVPGILQKLLNNKDFVAERLGPDAKAGIYTLYEDPEQGFCVLAHIYDNGFSGRPHDHGDSWAVYGVAEGYTDMTVWDRVDDGKTEGHAELKENRQFRIEPGKAAVFHPGDIHSISLPEKTRVVRVTGTDLDKIDRAIYDLDSQTIKIVARRAAG